MLQRSQVNEETCEAKDNAWPGFDPLRKYLFEVSKHPVLSREEEMEVADRGPVAIKSVRLRRSSLSPI